MPIIWGMDEAGYGPNLGPLVVALTCWDVPDLNFDFWSQLEGSICAEGTQNHTRLHIADSKSVHHSAAGIAAIELSAWSLLTIARCSANDLIPLLLDGHGLTPHPAPDLSLAPSYFGERSLPVEADGELATQLTAQLQVGLERSRCACFGVWAAVVWPARFNQLLEAHGNKSSVLTHISLQLLGSRWRSDDGVPQRVLADRHGGRKFYAGALQQMMGESAFVGTLSEAKELSRYRIGSTVIEFAEKSERYFPVAAASLVAKYLRELAMLEFNAFWTHHLPEIRPTKGYPDDAKRFLADAQETIAKLKLPLSSIWRER